MPNLMKMTKKQLVEIIECGQDTQFDEFKEEFGLPYHTADEWIDFIKSLQELNTERLKDLKECVELLNLMNEQNKNRYNNSGGR